ncbi:MAG: glycine cleavage system protein [Fibrobacteres bacterium]|nr:glycine cleavage system protein [Fibrobacterota bacterium]
MGRGLRAFRGRPDRKSQPGSKVTSGKKTPLYDIHVALNAKMVPFAGFIMPVQYSGIRQEHEAVRKTVGLFDVSHMGNFFVTGKGARGFLQRAAVNNVDKLKDMDAQYSALCYPNGTVVDDILVYRLSAERYKLVVNASNIDKDFAWLEGLRKEDPEGSEVVLRDASAELGILSLQGPHALDVARQVMEADPATIGTYKAGRGMVLGVDTLYSRTGYTGEDGFEFFPENKDLPSLWRALLEAGSRYGILPIGLGARDTLRLEAGYSLYGHELTDKTNLIEAGLSWITDFTKGDFTGRAALEPKSRPGGMERRVVGIELLELAIPREGSVIRAGGKDVGVVSSGTMSPTLNKGIAMAYVDVAHAKIGTELEVVIRDSGKKAKVVSRNFYKRAKA